MKPPSRDGLNPRGPVQRTRSTAQAIRHRPATLQHDRAPRARHASEQAPTGTVLSALLSAQVAALARSSADVRGDIIDESRYTVTADRRLSHAAGASLEIKRPTVFWSPWAGLPRAQDCSRAARICACSPM
ncbi:hypothetical protein PHLGIDRAFT_459495 [Phlebiopsis gigantea 11061_1 CR5-6]|uniref:Uncharacterized protein n=1 Tax=Phlebiopsis gigantea (strain 11061_1 CR5-6) TaxID=745531 RepID=A0A0C3S6Y5_PHLG1|nr:hypothetical protein PHLGIDRAFT_459495 [Phlebiopsis gigantea 11061_1 CR5-6]